MEEESVAVSSNGSTPASDSVTVTAASEVKVPTTLPEVPAVTVPTTTAVATTVLT